MDEELRPVSSFNGIQTVVIMPECDEADKDRSLSIPQDASFHIFERTSPFEKKIASRVKVDAFTQNEDFVSSIKRKARKYLSGLKQKIIVKGKNSLYANYVYLIDQI